MTAAPSRRGPSPANVAPGADVAPGAEVAPSADVASGAASGCASPSTAGSAYGLRPASLPPASAIYEGWVRHRRFEPVEHEFRYPLFLAYLDLAELPGVLDPFPGWSARRRAVARFRRADFLGDPERPLDACVRDEVEAATGSRPAGPVRLLSGLRYLGHSFNPVSFYYCFDPPGSRVEAVVADVENIPWGERHAYVLQRGEQRGTVLSEDTR